MADTVATLLTERAELRAEIERLKERLALLDPEEAYSLLLTLGDAVEALHGSMRRLADTHRIVLKALAQVSR